MAHTPADWNATTGEGVIQNKPVIVQNPMQNDLSMGGHFLTNLATPVNASDGATRGYVDSFVTGLSFKTIAKVATTANLVGTYSNGASGVGATFTITATGVLTIDGVATALNDRVVLKDQTTTFQNGIYFVSTAGSVGVQAVLTRALDADTGTELIAAAIFIDTGGATNAGKAFVQATPATITVGTTAIVWNLFLNSIYTAGTGITIASNIITAKVSAGVSGGQTAVGGTGAEDTFTIQGSSSVSGRTTTAPAIIHSSAGALTSSGSTAQVFESIVATVNQSGTAGYTLLKVAATETGTGSGTKLLFNYLAGAAGTTSKLSLTNTGVLNLADGGDLNIGSSTGSKIGTSASAKVGFFGATPVVQPVGDIATALSTLGLVSSPTLPGQTINTQSGTTYTFVLADANVLVTGTNAATQTFTVPPNSGGGAVPFPIGTHIDVAQLGAGKITLAQGAGVTINSAGSLKSVGGQYVAVTLIKTGTNTWLLIGNLIS